MPAVVLAVVGFTLGWRSRNVSRTIRVVAIWAAVLFGTFLAVWPSTDDSKDVADMTWTNVLYFVVGAMILAGLLLGCVWLGSIMAKSRRPEGPGS
jgi:hypothetical protein